MSPAHAPSTPSMHEPSTRLSRRAEHCSMPALNNPSVPLAPASRALSARGWRSTAFTCEGATARACVSHRCRSAKGARPERPVEMSAIYGFREGPDVLIPDFTVL
jgi:hypothetical protein